LKPGPKPSLSMAPSTRVARNLSLLLCKDDPWEHLICLTSIIRIGLRQAPAKTFTISRKGRRSKTSWWLRDKNTCNYY